MSGPDGLRGIGRGAEARADLADDVVERLVRDVRFVLDPARAGRRPSRAALAWRALMGSRTAAASVGAAAALALVGGAAAMVGWSGGEPIAPLSVEVPPPARAPEAAAPAPPAIAPSPIASTATPASSPEKGGAAIDYAQATPPAAVAALAPAPPRARATPRERPDSGYAASPAPAEPTVLRPTPMRAGVAAAAAPPRFVRPPVAAPIAVLARTDPPPPMIIVRPPAPIPPPSAPEKARARRESLDALFTLRRQW